MLSGLLLSLMLSASVDAAPAVSDLLGIPYVDDAVLDERGRWTFFEHPDRTAKSPGLNCSGLVTAAARRLLGRAPTLAEATRDRLGDSGADAPSGKDWDFGYDLVMNLSEGLPRRALLPDGAQGVESGDGRTLRGFATGDAEAWRKVLPGIVAGRLYLASLSRKGKRLEHHHVALVLRDEVGRVWLYQTLPKGRAHRLELTSEQGLRRVRESFAGTSVLLLEVEPAREVDAAPRGMKIDP